MLRVPLPKYTFINGPPGSGKSTLAAMLCEADTSLYRESFANPIREMIYAVFYPDEGPISFEFDLRDSETKKAFIPNLGSNAPSVTNREAMIGFSETYMKPLFGEDIFGRLGYARCKSQEDFYETFVFDDSGFIPEAQYIINQEGVENCLLIHLQREGCDFVGDSRNYIDLPIRTLTLVNDGPPKALLAELELQLGNL